MGVWIETYSVGFTCLLNGSHPVWVCGLKLYNVVILRHHRFVTPCMGVWIETDKRADPCFWHSVTPCMGVWIETVRNGIVTRR